jgi:hypothetical protein
MEVHVSFVVPHQRDLELPLPHDEILSVAVLIDSIVGGLKRAGVDFRVILGTVDRVVPPVTVRVPSAATKAARAILWER